MGTVAATPGTLTESPCRATALPAAAATEAENAPLTLAVAEA